MPAYHWLEQYLVMYTSKASTSIDAGRNCFWAHTFLFLWLSFVQAN